LAKWAVFEPNGTWTNNFPIPIVHYTQKDMDLV
jgi:hypothetical protein